MTRPTGTLAVLAAIALGASVTLTSCTAAAQVGVLRRGDTAVILIGRQCGDASYPREVAVGRADGLKFGPAVWTIQADRPRAVPELPVGTVPDGYHVTVDDLHGAAIGQEFWVRWTDGDQESSSVPFKLSKIKDGSVMDSSGNVISRADFDKRYHC